MDRMGVRLRLRQAQANAGDIVLLYADESEALTHPYLAHAWAEQGADLRVRAPGQSRKVALMGALDAGTRLMTCAGAGADDRSIAPARESDKNRLMTSVSPIESTRA